MNQPNPTPPPPRGQLNALRIIWLAMLLGQLGFLGVILSGAIAHDPSAPQQPLLVWVDLGMLLTIVPATFVVRALILRRGEIEGGILIGAYSTGNIIFWAGCEGVSFFGLVIAIVNGSLWPTIVIAGVAMGLQVLTFPVGARVHIPAEQSQFRT